MPIAIDYYINQNSNNHASVHRHFLNTEYMCSFLNSIFIFFDKSPLIEESKINPVSLLSIKSKLAPIPMFDMTGIAADIASLKTNPQFSLLEAKTSTWPIQTLSLIHLHISYL